MKPRLTELPYVCDSTDRFAVFAERPWCVFLDSGGPATEYGRYDILAADPYLTLTAWGDITIIQSRDGKEYSSRDPFTLLKRCLGEVRKDGTGLPFSGGAIGYFAYDLARRIENLPKEAIQDINMPDMAIGLYDWAVVVDHREKRAWLVGQGRDERTLDDWDQLEQLMQSPVSSAQRKPFCVLSAVSSNMDRDIYAQAFRRIKHYIHDGDCYQVNLAQRFSVKVQGDLWDAYVQLRALNPAPFSAFFQLPEGTVLSSSPERFLRLLNGWVETKPVKGTRPRSVYKHRDRSLAEELLKSSKDRAENVMIVDLVRNDLGKTCRPGTVEVPKLFALESFATVHHLVSTITGELAPGQHAFDLLRGCFPGGSITGAPKVRAMQIIEELEPHRRSVYCGAIGYIGFNGDMDTNIAIRTLVYN
ncbi:MAG: aminodeoxychorismate synthase component I, partial [Gammaproteobacteria bacterium]|nr:aminodeoxychorismate synthase component I [Gammaproteobacteria bacterium]